MFWSIVYAILSVHCLTLAALAIMQTNKLRGRLRREPARTLLANFGPEVWLIVPFKGLDRDLAACVGALCTQTYPHYRLVLVVDSPSDPAFAVVRDALARHPQRKAELLVSGSARDDESQKVHNQVFALRHIESLAGESDVLAFADSDATPSSGWLMEMVMPLVSGDKIAMTTGYRWLVPLGTEASPGGSFWSHLVSVMNSSIACVYRNRLTSRAWGGAMAMTLRTAREGDLIGSLRGSLSDDYQVTRMCWRLKRKIWFVPRALVASPVDFDFKGFVAFARRQYLITRIYMPITFTLGVLMYGSWVAGVAINLAALVAALAGASFTLFPWYMPAGVMVSLHTLHQVRYRARRRVVRDTLGSATLDKLRPAMALDRWCTSLWMTAHWLIMLSACVGRTITWRDITYRMDGRQNIKRVRKE